LAKQFTRIVNGFAKQAKQQQQTTVRAILATGDSLLLIEMGLARFFTSSVG
jgi:hypothetical protein